MLLSSALIFEQLNATFPEVELSYDEAVPCVIVEPMAMKKIALQLRDAKPYCFDSLMCLSGVDNADGTLGVVYHLYSFKHNHKLTLKTIVQKDEAKVESVEKVWRTADWHEREAFDLLGIEFVGHRNLRRILMPYDWEGFPLQKDYKVPEFYNGIKVPY